MPGPADRHACAGVRAEAGGYAQGMPSVSLPRPVKVLHDGTWVDGWLEAVRRDPEGWRGFVRYAVGPGMRHLQWRPEHELRRA
jgi:hypothetical protein